MKKLDQNKRDETKALNQAIRSSIREKLLESEMFLSGENFTRSDISRMMPGKNKIHIQNLTSILKAEGILCAIKHTHKPTIFYRNKPENRPWMQKSWRLNTNAELGFEESLVR
jgi:hypothetical protein